MKILLCDKEIRQISRVHHALRELLEDRFLGYTCSEAFIAETRTELEEMMIYILPDDNPLETKQRLEVIGRALAKELSLKDTQVICSTPYR